MLVNVCRYNKEEVKRGIYGFFIGSYRFYKSSKKVTELAQVVKIQRKTDTYEYTQLVHDGLT